MPLHLQITYPSLDLKCRDFITAELIEVETTAAWPIETFSCNGLDKSNQKYLKMISLL